MRTRRLAIAFLVLLLCSCAGISRKCSSWCADTTGADWIVVQMDMNGHAFRCWELEDVSIANEESSDGIYWKSDEGHLVHISGLYNRVQVKGGHWEDGYRELGLTRDACRTIRERQDLLTRPEVVHEILRQPERTTGDGS